MLKGLQDRKKSQDKTNTITFFRMCCVLEFPKVQVLSTYIFSSGQRAIFFKYLSLAAVRQTAWLSSTILGHSLLFVCCYSVASQDPSDLLALLLVQSLHDRRNHDTVISISMMDWVQEFLQLYMSYQQIYMSPNRKELGGQNSLFQ